MGKTFSTGLLTNGIWQDASNNIGIGGSPSGSYKLEVTGTGRFSGSVGIGTTAALTSKFTVFSPDASTSWDSTSPLATISNLDQTNGQAFALLVRGGALDANCNIFEVQDYSASSKLVVKGTGNVGIGTTTPSYKLDVVSLGSPSARVRNGDLGGTATLLLETANNFSGTCQTYIQCIGSTGTGLSTLTFGTAGASGDSTATERMRINSDGSIEMQGTNSSAKFKFWRNYSNNQPGLAVYNTSNTEIFYFNGNTGDLGITGQGYKPGGGSWANSSDIRLKENVKTIENALDKVMQLRGVTFDWKQGYTENGKKESGGFIADEVMEVFPDWVSETNTTEAQKEIVNDEKIKSLSLPFSFDALLVEAIKELSNKTKI